MYWGFCFLFLASFFKDFFLRFFDFALASSLLFPFKCALTRCIWSISFSANESFFFSVLCHLLLQSFTKALWGETHYIFCFDIQFLDCVKCRND
jgi:hypothetical protein